VEIHLYIKPYHENAVAEKAHNSFNGTARLVKAQMIFDGARDFRAEHCLH
jgi:hypothetical protein